MLRILLIAHSFNSLTQRLFVDLRRAGHEVSVELDIHPGITAEAVGLFAPDLVIAPFLKRAIPDSVWRNVTCLVVHPGIPGDRGPSALDWAILAGEQEWGVSIIEATGEFDAGPVWAFEPFAMRAAAKSSLYRNEVTEAAVQAVLRSVTWFATERRRPVSLLGPAPSRMGSWRSTMTQQDRRIDWQRDGSAMILRAIRSADGMPGLRAEVGGETVHLHDAHLAEGLAGPPGTVVAGSGGDVAIATADGAIWVGQARRAGPGEIKLPASRVIPTAGQAVAAGAGPQRIRFERLGDAGFLHFAFYNGAMGTAAAHRLTAAFTAAAAAASGVRVLVLMGGPDYWSNGMDLNLIEAAASPADESWDNINALDDLAEAILRATGVVTIAALQGNAGAGGVFLARAADRLWMRNGVILNPHYKDMGNLHGSEFWTYLLPCHCGTANARRIAAERLPMGAAEAVELGLADAAFGTTVAEFAAEVQHRATLLATAPLLPELLAAKRARRAADEAEKPLARWRSEELDGMRRSFYGADPSYHVARYNFVHKVPKARTPLTIAANRRGAARRRLP